MFPLEQSAWLLFTLLLLAFLQRRLHYEIQSLFLLLFQNSSIASLLFSVLFFPGILLHEGSHYVCARLLGVPTGRLSLLPKPLSEGQLQLGFVETARTDLFRDALIGIAPLLTGMSAIAYLTLHPLGMSVLWENENSLSWHTLWNTLLLLPKHSDFWLWLYLIFVISSTMLPSASDRRAWLPLAIVMFLVLGCAWFVGADRFLVETWRWIAPWIISLLRALGLVFAMSATLHTLLLPPCWLVNRILSRKVRIPTQTKIS